METVHWSLLFDSTRGDKDKHSLVMWMAILVQLKAIRNLERFRQQRACCFRDHMVEYRGLAKISLGVELFV